MKKTSFIIITAVMMCLAVQGYAQDRHQRGNHSNNRMEQRGHSSGYTRSGAGSQRSVHQTPSSQRSVRQSPSSSSSQHNRVGAERPTTQQRPSSYQKNSRPAQQNYGNRSAHRPENRSHGYARSSRPAGPPHAYRPTPPPPRYHHHHSYLHHTYHCYFNDWYWYTWGGYRNRFIRHRLYYDRFFDNMLGYYLWGTMTAPTKLEIGNLTLTRYNNTLKVQIGTECSYVDLYIVQQTVYQVGNTMVSVTTGSGYAEVRFYDEYGNEAVYSL